MLKPKSVGRWFSNAIGAKAKMINWIETEEHDWMAFAVLKPPTQ